MVEIAHDPDEVLAVVDDEDRVIGKATRREVHEKGLLHREVYVFVWNNLIRRVLLQKRKDCHKWCFSAGGHFPYEENYLEGAQRETRQELGVELGLGSFSEIDYGKLFRKINDANINFRFAKIFLLEANLDLNKFNPDFGEVEEIRYFDRLDLLEILADSDSITSPSRNALQKYILRRI